MPHQAASLFNGSMNHGRGRPSSAANTPLPHLDPRLSSSSTTNAPEIRTDPKIGVRLPRSVRISGNKRAYAWAAQKQQDNAIKARTKEVTRGHHSFLLRASAHDLLVTRALDESATRIKKLSSDLGRLGDEHASAAKVRFLLSCWQTYQQRVREEGLSGELGCAQNYARQFNTMYEKNATVPRFVVVNAADDSKEVLSMT